MIAVHLDKDGNVEYEIASLCGMRLKVQSNVGWVLFLNNLGGHCRWEHHTGAMKLQTKSR